MGFILKVTEALTTPSDFKPFVTWWIVVGVAGVFAFFFWKWVSAEPPKE
jgi:uncharacterized membrane protein